MTFRPAVLAGGRGGPAVAPRPISYAHLVRLSDEVGVFEHAEMLRPRLEHGYCVDDVARVLVVLAREPRPTPELAALLRTCLTFVLDAVVDDGRVHNRRVHGGGWTDEAGVEDCWGRALWGLGTVAARSPDAEISARAYEGFERAASRRSPDRHATAFAALGAAEILVERFRHAVSRTLLGDAARLLDTRPMMSTPPDPAWPWPEPRLRYANAALPDALIAAGDLLGDDGRLARGLEQLEWLVDLETAGAPGARHRSMSPARGWAVGEPRPGFDQQPIEVAALADACARAGDLAGGATRDWDAEVLCCEAWFRGANDVGVPMLDPESGGGYDGLEPDGRNENQGAESTLALLSTLQQARRVRSRA
ncbi:MAG: glycosyltransferase [Lapillicoccus sp.]